MSSLFARIRSESEIAADEKAAADAGRPRERRSRSEVVEVETIELVEEIVVIDGEVVADTVTVEVDRRRGRGRAEPEPESSRRCPR